MIDKEELQGEDCYVGIDLSSTQDITAAVFVFPRPDGSVAVLPRFWIPEEGLRKRVKRDRVPYDTWLQDELVFATDGNVVDYEAIRHQLHEDGDRFRIREIAIDRWNATQLTTQLTDDGLTVVPFGQGFKSMSGPTKELEKLVLEGKLYHGGNPVLRWMASNVAVKQDPAGNLKPDKQKSSDRIDGVVAMVMGLGRAIVQPEDPASVYETRGILTL